MASEDDTDSGGGGSEKAGSEKGGWQIPLPKGSLGKSTKEHFKKGYGSKKEETGKGQMQKNAEEDPYSHLKKFELGPVYKIPKKHGAVATTQKGKEDGTYLEVFAGEYQVEAGSVGVDFEKMKASATVLEAKIKGSVVHGKWDIAETLGLNDKEGYGVTYAPQAARLGDPTVHGTPLYPGGASPDVVIGGKPAWRTWVDFHACPLAHPPHVGGVVAKGAATVLINHHMACRAGDIVVEVAGGNNPIAMGCPTVLIGEAAPPAKKRDLVEVSAEGELLTAEAEATLKAEVDLKNGEVELIAKAGFKAAAATAKVEGERHIPIPFTDYNIAIGGSAEVSVLTVAAEAEASVKINEIDPVTKKRKLGEVKMGGTLGAAIFGGGLGFSLGIEED